MASLYLSRPRGRFHDLPLAIKSIAGFWSFYLLTLIVRSVLVGDGVGELISRRTATVLIGIALTGLIYLALKLFAAKGSMRRMIIVAALACVPAAMLFSVASFAVLMMNDPLISGQIDTQRVKDGTVVTRTPGGEIRIQRGGRVPAVVFQDKSISEIVQQSAPRWIADSTVTWYFFFSGWAAFYVVLSSANQLRLAERRASEFEKAAQSAQLRALRYQVNPHFLFNTLNSLSSLIMSRREEEAERMVMNLSNFFRSTLSIDPTADVSLSEEIALQMLYLDIEKARFPNRLKVEVDIPETLQNARIPALLLQPVVENAIKYGVARARNVVTLAIHAARRDDGMLRVTIDNSGASGSAAEPDEASTGVGLNNVCQRLAARFGDAASCHYGARAEGGFNVTLTMPLVTHG